MKIAIFTDASPPQVNGVVIYLQSILPFLVKDHEIFIYHPRTTKKIEFLRHPKITHVAVRSVPLLFYPDVRLTSVWSPAIGEFFAKNIPDVVHVHTPGSIGIMGLLAAKRYSVPLIQTFHTYYTEPEYLKILKLDKIGMHESVTLQNILWKMTSMLYNQSNLVLAGTKSLKSDLKKHGIKVPIQIEAFGSTQAISKKNKSNLSFKLPNDYLLYTGRMSQEKNVDILLDAFAIVYKKFPRLFLLLVGDGPIMSNLKDKCEKLQIQDNVIFTGLIDNRLLRGSMIISNAIAFVTASTSEMRPVSVMEAMGEKVLVVGVKKRGLIDLLGNNRGLLASPNSAKSLATKILAVLTNQVDKKTIIKNAYDFIMECSPEIHSQKLSKIYSKLLSLKSTQSNF